MRLARFNQDQLAGFRIAKNFADPIEAGAGLAHAVGGALDGLALVHGFRRGQRALGAGRKRGEQAAGEHQHHVHQIDQAGAGVFVPVVETGVEAGIQAQALAGSARTCGAVEFLGELV